MGATMPYYQDPKIRFCPSTKPDPVNDRNTTNWEDDDYGSTTEQWGYLGISRTDTWWDEYPEGSYGFNEWCADPPPGVQSFWGLPCENAIRKATTSGADNIPLVLDSVYVDTAVRDTDAAPSNDEHSNDVYRASWDNDAMSVLPEDIQDDICENFSPEYLAEKLSDHIVSLQGQIEALKAELDKDNGNG